MTSSLKCDSLEDKYTCTTDSVQASLRERTYLRHEEARNN